MSEIKQEVQPSLASSLSGMLLIQRGLPGEEGTCRVSGCHVVLACESQPRSQGQKARVKICQEHRRADFVSTDEGTQRYCQQCMRLHPISEFDGTKRCCRKRLSRHHTRREKKRSVRRNMSVYNKIKTFCDEAPEELPGSLRAALCTPTTSQGALSAGEESPANYSDGAVNSANCAWTCSSASSLKHENEWQCDPAPSVGTGALSNGHSPVFHSPALVAESRRTSDTSCDTTVSTPHIERSISDTTSSACCDVYYWQRIFDQQAAYNNHDGEQADDAATSFPLPIDVPDLDEAEGWEHIDPYRIF